MKPARLVALAAAVLLVTAAPSAADLLPPIDPALPTDPIVLPPTNVLSSLATHGVDPLSISIALEVPPPLGGAGGAPLDSGVTVDAAAVQKSEPSSWCGEERSTDDSADVLANGDNRFHAIYALPADAPDRFKSLASSLQTDAFQASGLIERLYGRAIRYDMGTSCGGRFLDISAVRLPQTTAQLQSIVATTNATYATIVDDLAKAGFPTIGAGQAPSTFTGHDDYLVWYDGPAPAGCGQGAFYDDTTRDPANANNAAGKVAVVFPDGSGGFCNSNAARHEMGHNMGAVQKAAPHSDGGGHCNDTAGDTMCITTGPVNGDTFQSLYFDAHDDDYWGPLAWWTVDESRFVCQSVACNVPGGLAARQTTPTSGGGGFTPSGSTGGGGSVRSSASTPRATLTATHRGSRWRYRLRIRGSGRARVTVSCRRSGRTVRLKRRVVRLPATVSGSGRCDARPRVAVKRLR